MRLSPPPTNARMHKGTLSNEFHGDGHGSASSQAQAGNSPAAITASEGIQQGGQYSGTAGPDGMTQGHGSTMDVESIRIQWDFLDEGDRLGGKSLIDFIKVDVRITPAGTLQNLPYGLHRSHHDP